MTIVLFSNAQNTLLESKKGFKDFIIGTSTSQFTSQLKYIDDIKGEKHYVYTGSCCQTMVDYPVDKIDLFYKDDKLVTIKVSLKPVGNGSEGNNKAWATLNKFSDNFGKADDVKQGTDGNTIFRAFWTSKSYIMALNIGYYDFKVGFVPEVFIMDKNKKSDVDF
jgi:hypothetical protein